MAIDFPDNPVNLEKYTYNDGAGRVVTYTYIAAKDSWTGEINTSIQIAQPLPSQVRANPPFNSGTGTQEDPYIVTAGICATQGLGVVSSQQIIVSGQTLGQRIYFNDQSQNAGLRFQQPLGVIDGFGTYNTNLYYNDSPISDVDGIIYSALLQVGTAWLSWNVTQQVTSPISQNSATSISVSDSVYKVGATASMVSGTITGGEPGAGYIYEYWWQRSADGSDNTFVNITQPTSDVSAKNYVIQESDTDYFIRAVTQATDSTVPVKQTLTMNSPNSTTKVFGPPKIANVLLIDDDGDSVNRFTSQSFTTNYSLSTLGTGNSTKDLKVILTKPDDSIVYAILNVSGAITNVTAIDPGYVTMTDQVSPTVTFPATFTDALIPDEALPPGTSIQTDLKVLNLYGADNKTSNIITPIVVGEVVFPTPNLINGFIQSTDPFVADETPFNTAVVQGTDKETYAFAWGISPTTITFDPPWDVSATPITSFQGGGLVAGINDFKVTFVDGSDNSTVVTVSTPNSDWSTPIQFGSFVPPTTIKSIILTSENLSDKTNGIINFYDTNNASVLYDNYSFSQNNLTRSKLESLDISANWATRSDAATYNIANPSTPDLDAFILPKAGFDSNNIYILHLDKAPGAINVSIEILLTNLSVFTLIATNLSQSVTYKEFLSNLITGLSTDSRVTVAAVDGAITITPAATYAIDDVKITLTSGTLTSQAIDDVNGTAVGAPTVPNTFTVTVANKTGTNHTYGLGSLKAYFINTIEANTLAFTKGLTYRFNQSDASNTGHPLRFYTDAAKTTEYTTGVTTDGTPGTVGAYTQIATTNGAPAILYYQCSNHAYMGGQITLS